MASNGAHIDPENFYDGDALYQLLALPSSTLASARRSGELQFVRRGNRTLYRGQWILDWLMSGTHKASAVRVETDADGAIETAKEGA